MIAVAKTTDDGRCTRIPRRDSTTCLSLQNTEWELFSDWRCRVFLFVVVDVQSKQAVSQVSVKDVSLCFLSFSCLLRRERNWNQKGLQKSLELLHELPLEMNYLENFVLINIISELALSFLICCIFSHSLTLEILVPGTTWRRLLKGLRVLALCWRVLSKEEVGMRCSSMNVLQNAWCWLRTLSLCLLSQSSPSFTHSILRHWLWRLRQTIKRRQE